MERAKYNNKTCQTENLQAVFFDDGEFPWNSVVNLQPWK